jgi:hypothetical protein
MEEEEEYLRAIYGYHLQMIDGLSMDITCKWFSREVQWELSLGASVTQLSEQAPFTSVFVGLILATDSYVKRVSQRSAESRGFSSGAPVSSHRGSWKGGL